MEILDVISTYNKLLSDVYHESNMHLIPAYYLIE